MLDIKRLTGPSAGSIKYDLLTALSVAGMAGSPTFQTSMCRLIALVTARYNWRLDEVSVGQRDIARMWSVNERTVKREIKRLLEANILLKIRSGVRGRVSAYRLNYREILKQSQPVWKNVGPDFEERMSVLWAEERPKVVAVDFENKRSIKLHVPAEPTGNWRDVCRQLKQIDPDLFTNWFSKLDMIRFEDSTLYLSASSAFVLRYIETNLQTKLFTAAKPVFPSLDRISLAETPR